MSQGLAITSALCAVCARYGRFQMQEAHILIGLGRPAEALQLLEPAQPSGLDLTGVAELEAMKACAYHGVGRQADAERQLALLTHNPHHDPDAVLGGLLCAGDDDRVATTLVSMLRDPQTRDAALADLQVYHEGQLPALTRALRARLAVIAARPDVQTALNAVGRVETYDMPRYAIVG